MHNIDDVNSILNAINEINLKPKKKNIDLVNAQIKIPKLNQDFKISPDVKKLIEDAEAYKKKLSSSTLQLNLIHPKNFISKTKNYDKTLEDIQSEIIKNIYTKFSKKIKKNTLKIIFNLHLKIKDLENKLENFQTKKEHSSNAEISTVKIKKEQLVNIEKNDINFKKEKNIKDDVITSLRIQDSTIGILNKKIETFKRNEEKFLLQIIDLEQDKTLLLLKEKKYEVLEIDKIFINNVKELLRVIYNRVEKHKKIFIDLKNYTTKVDRNSSFFKQNYENLIIENNETKKRLTIAKNQIVVHENNKQELLLSLSQLNKTLSKTNITAKISPLILSSEANISKK